MRHILLGLAIAGAVAIVPITSQAAQGSCAHNEMRSWVDSEEVCYHTHGPLSEEWNIHNQTNQDALDGCLKSARTAYVKARVGCELRGETAYRKDGIHKDWEKYRPHYETVVSRIRQGI